MPTAVFSFKPPLADGTLLVHVAISPSQTAADKALKGHADVCPQYGPPFRADQTVEIAREVDSIPDFSDPDALEEWLDELMGMDVDDDAEDEPLDVGPR